MIVSVTGGVISVGDPSVKSATHSTSVPLDSDLAGMVRVDTIAPFSVIALVLMPGNSPVSNPFTLQPMASAD